MKKLVRLCDCSTGRERYYNKVVDFVSDSDVKSALNGVGWEMGYDILDPKTCKGIGFEAWLPDGRTFYVAYKWVEVTE